jgi:F0F1-type ATP synthase assembly protein I
MSTPDHPTPNRIRNILIVGVAIVAGQVGLVTFAIILGAVLGGLWLDNRFNTRPTYTLALLCASVPVSIIVMLLIVRKAVKRIKTESARAKTALEEETDLGKDS